MRLSRSARPQTYRTRRHAERYASELHRARPDLETAVIVTRAFRFAVQVRLPDGRTALAGRRPRRFASTGPDAQA